MITEMASLPARACRIGRASEGFTGGSGFRPKCRALIYMNQDLSQNGTNGSGLVFKGPASGSCQSARGVLPAHQRP